MRIRAILLAISVFAASNSYAGIIVGYSLPNHTAANSESIDVFTPLSVIFQTGSTAQVLQNVKAWLGGLSSSIIPAFSERAQVDFFTADAFGLPSSGSLASAQVVGSNNNAGNPALYTFSGFSPLTLQANTSYLAVFSAVGFGNYVVQGSSGPQIGNVGASISGYRKTYVLPLTVRPLAFQINSAVVPEPSSLALLGVLAASGFGVSRLRRRKSEKASIVAEAV